MRGVHGDDAHACGLPERRHRRERGRIGVGERRQDAPAVVKQVGKARGGAGMLGAGDGMAGHEMHARGDMGQHVADHRLLDRAHVGDDRAGFERRPDRLGDLGIGGERRPQHHEIGPRYRRRGIRGGAVAELELKRRVEGLLAARAGDDLAGELVPAQHMGDRGIDEPDADEGDALGSAARSRSAEEIGAGLDDGAHLLLRADGDAQPLRQVIAAHLARQDAAGLAGTRRQHPRSCRARRRTARGRSWRRWD